MNRHGAWSLTIVLGILAFIIGVFATVLVKAHIARRAQVWGQVAAWALPCEPRHIASAGDQIVVCGGRMVLWLASEGVVLARQELPEEPLRVAVQADGVVWAVSPAALWRTGREGKPERIADLPARPVGLAVSEGRVWVSDAQGLRIQTPGSQRPELLALDPGMEGGELRPAVAGGVWLALPSQGRIERWQGGKRQDAFTPCQAPWFAVFPDGRFALAGGPDRLVRVSAPDGSVNEVVIVLPAGVSGTVPTVDGRGRLLVLDGAGRQVRVFERRVK